MELEINSKLYLSDNIIKSFQEKENDYSNIHINIIINILYIIFIILFINFSFFIFYLIFIVQDNKPITNSKFINNKEEIKYEIDSHYEKISSKDENYIYIPIIATNDFHGKFFPELNEINYNSKDIKYKTGGLEYISKYITTLKKEFDDNKVLYLDSGDQFFQTNETILFTGRNIFDFLNVIGLNGTTLGNHEYLYKRSFIEKLIKKANYPYLVNNIRDITTNKTENILGKNQYNSYLYDIKLNNGDIIKIGVIGITMKIGEDK